MELSEQFSESLAELEDVGTMMTWNGGDYPAFAGTAVLGKDLGMGGFKLRADLKLIIRSGVLPDPGPQIKDRITYLSREYRIDTIEIIPGEPFVRFECNDPTQ